MGDRNGHSKNGNGGKPKVWMIKRDSNDQNRHLVPGTTTLAFARTPTRMTRSEARAYAKHLGIMCEDTVTFPLE